MPRPRNAENKGLPSRWQFFHGAYYYQVPSGQEAAWDGKRKFRLGKTLPEAYREWAKRLNVPPSGNLKMDALFDRYLLHELPMKSASTQKDIPRYIKRLRAVFGHMLPKEIVPQHVYRYYTKCVSKFVGRLEVATLSHVLTKSVEWGEVERHPFKGDVRLPKNPPRSRYITDEEFAACLAMQSEKKTIRQIQAYINLKYLIGIRRADMLNLKESDLSEEGIMVTPQKTAQKSGKTLIFAWTPALREAVERVIAARPARSAYLFCNRRGQPYRGDGWHTNWANFIVAALASGAITERFTEHDIRAKAGSDAGSVERAQELLGHESPATTQRHYRRKATIVQPLK